MNASYTETRAKFVQFWNQIVETREPLIVTRKGAEDMAMLPASELAALMETAHLLRSPKNAKKLLKALKRSLQTEIPELELDGLSREVDHGQSKS